MADYIIDGATLTGIADVIRTAEGTSELIPPEEMAERAGNLYDAGYENGFGEGKTAEAAKIDSLIDGTIKSFGRNLGATKIRDYVFYKCSEISTINCNTATSIGVSACNGCTKLYQVKCPNATGTVGSNAFTNCTTLTLVDLSQVASISSYAFDNCSSLEEINFSKIKSIGASSFRKCGRLKALVLTSNTVSSLSSASAFTGTPIADGTGYIYVPDDRVDAYKAATNWSTYASQIKPLSEYEGGLT